MPVTTCALQKAKLASCSTPQQLWKFRPCNHWVNNFSIHSVTSRSVTRAAYISVCRQSIWCYQASWGDQDRRVSRWLRQTGNNWSGKSWRMLGKLVGTSTTGILNIFKNSDSCTQDLQNNLIRKILTKVSCWKTHEWFESHLPLFWLCLSCQRAWDRAWRRTDM